MQIIDNIFDVVEIFEENSTVLIVTGKKSFIKSKIGLDFINELVEKSNFVYFFNDFTSNVQAVELDRGIKIVEQNRPDIIIGIGGGSVLDMAKLLSMKFENSEIAISHPNLHSKSKPTPLILIPTTSGSGSEATYFSVLYNNLHKYSIQMDDLNVNGICLDYRLTKDLSDKQRRISAFDALCQSIESIWSLQANNESRIFASESLKLLWEVFPRMINNSYLSDDNLKKLQFGAFLAGKAINISKTTAPHAMSYGLTQIFNISHGHAVALVFKEVFEINIKKLNSEIVDLLLSSTGVENIEELQLTFSNWLKFSGLELKIKCDSIELDSNRLTQLVNKQRLKNNPVEINETSIKEIYLKILIQ